MDITGLIFEVLRLSSAAAITGVALYSTYILLHGNAVPRYIWAYVSLIMWGAAIFRWFVVWLVDFNFALYLQIEPWLQPFTQSVYVLIAMAMIVLMYSHCKCAPSDSRG